MSYDINWSDLNLFLIIAQEKSLAGAAKKMGVTHSTVFRKINSLESNIKTKLFFRNNDGYKLTEIGEEVLTYVNQVANQVNGINQLLDNRNLETKGKIHITAPHNLAYNFLPKYISKFRELYPDITLNLSVSNTDYNLSKLEADIAIRATQNPPENVIGKKLFSLKWAAYVADKFIETFGTPDIDNINEFKVIAADKSLISLSAFRWVEDNIKKENIIARCNDLMSMSAFALSGIGIALLPDDQAKPGLNRLFDLPDDIRSDIWVLIHPDMRQCKRLILLRDFLIQEFKKDSAFVKYAVYD